MPWCHVRRWLTGPGSLSARLQAVCESFTVQRVRQGATTLREDERSGLQRRSRCRVHAREVILRCDGAPVVYARSVVDDRHVRGPWRALAGLGTRPLAQLLFQERAIARSPLEYQRLAPHSTWHRHVKRQWLQATGEPLPAGALWARRSRFTKSRATLLLIEVFSPSLARRRAPVKRR
jgi:chorismate--pyruvate lyase